MAAAGWRGVAAWVCGALWLGWASGASAQDQWSEASPGVAHLYRAAPGQRIHAAFIDLGRPELYVRTTRTSERGQTVTSFARQVGAVAAINGDWFSYEDYSTVGLAVGQGEPWENSADTPEWSFLACTLEKECAIYSEDTQPTHWRMYSAVGGNGAILVKAGQVRHYEDAFYSSDRHPRSAVGLTQDRRQMIMVTVQGRRDDSRGMTFNEVADLMAEFGAYDAMMLDGGGSSSLVLGGQRVNDLPSGASERVVANHLSIVAGPLDGRCAPRPNGRFCLDAANIAQCEGGNYSTGDCSFFGASCEETAGIGYCVHPYCQRGGNGSFCVNNAVIATCELGRYSEGDCSFFGASCEDDGGSAYCVHPYCARGGNGVFCRDADVLVRCSRGALAEESCAAQGLVCADDGATGACVQPGAPPERCGDAQDNDADGAADCQDPGCALDPACQAPDDNNGGMNNGGSMGNNGGASGNNDGSMGNNAGASGNNGGSMGNNAGASGNNDGSMGNNAGASGDTGGSMGNNAGASGNNDGSMGNNAGASGNNDGSSGNNDGAQDGANDEAPTPQVKAGCAAASAPPRRGAWWALALLAAWGWRARRGGTTRGRA